jgi:predicted transcriptional regulator
MAMEMSDPSVHNLTREQLMKLLKLPSHLQKTMKTILELGEATADRVAERTGRVRATESDYLNQLERMGFVKRRWQGRNVHFSPT